MVGVAIAFVLGIGLCKIIRPKKPISTASGYGLLWLAGLAFLGSVTFFPNAFNWFFFVGDGLPDSTIISLRDKAINKFVLFATVMMFAGPVVFVTGWIYGRLKFCWSDKHRQSPFPKDRLEE